MSQISSNLGMHHLLIGYDTALGRGREGNAARLSEIGDEFGYTVRVIPPLSDDGGIISSTRIRQSILEGNVSAAAEDLGRYYNVTGPVVHGDGRGHRINVPTANIQAPGGKIIPANGIYACWAWLNPEQGSAMEKKYMAATNVGVRPTFTPDLPAPTIEAYLLDFNRDLYGQQIGLSSWNIFAPNRNFLRWRRWSSRSRRTLVSPGGFGIMVPGHLKRPTFRLWQIDMRSNRVQC